ncbi:DUF1223 domain-containing protein [Microvirga puerhi]|uniref:DUF1223 domain-containing protein n=1 Tax=Microvirga puerhi TaxID=2876078 RepID=A0ABS7VKW3_9HYPH|nr:DUF1223 domain-containing protein [Microvirga puerhi]MBZ6075652.1 DUF1223 domain-containing protein [Microvirga puerhi]
MVSRSNSSRVKTVLAALGLAILIQPALAEPPRAVIELFTSQGCSSCPPADALLSSLSHQADLVALSFPVDYWDYLGWKDTLAQPLFTARQKAYAESRSDKQVYTPQIVVNGTKPCIGSDHARIEKSIQTTNEGRPSLPLDVSLKEENGIVTISVEETPHSNLRRGEVWVLPVLRSQSVTIGRGENRGKTVTYANVVRGMTRVGEWRGGAARFQIPLAAARREADGYVVLVQSGEDSRPGPILGAAKGGGL